MTAMMRQICKQILTMLGAALLAWGLVGAPAVAAALVTRIVTNPLTGVAIEGYDPITYFTETEPQPGSPDYEYYWGGVPWYFVSEANRDVFMRAPEIYAPQFGGHCAMSLSRGYLSDGKPRIYAIEKMQLYLFYSTANREAFLISTEEARGQAALKWQELAGELSGPPIDAAVGPPTEPAASH
jgi:hypothetical protein